MFESIRKTGLIVHADSWLSANTHSDLEKTEDVHFKGSGLTIQKVVSLLIDFDSKVPKDIRAITQRV